MPMSPIIARSRRGRGRPRAGGRRPFKEVEGPPIDSPLDAWAGWLGEGWGPGQSLFVTSGTRGNGGTSTIYRQDAGGGGWVNDGAPNGQIETINKIRSTGDRLYAFSERPASGQTWLISRDFGGGWGFEGVPSALAAVGGRGLGINPADFSQVYAGASPPGIEVAAVFKKNGGWAGTRTVENSLMWELEFDAQGRLWEFFNNFGRGVSAVYVGGTFTGESYGGDISSANWFDGHMYTIGALSLEHSQDIRNVIARSANGGTWEKVHSFEHAVSGDHILTIPREPPELWAVGHDPLEVHYSLNGTEWTREDSIPSFATGKDTNHLTAIAFWQGAVWVFSRDASRHNAARAFTDGKAVRDLMIEVI
jgi:hypothetical protein